MMKYSELMFSQVMSDFCRCGYIVGGVIDYVNSKDVRILDYFTKDLVGILVLTNNISSKNILSSFNDLKLYTWKTPGNEYIRNVIRDVEIISKTRKIPIIHSDLLF